MCTFAKTRKKCRYVPWCLYVCVCVYYINTNTTLCSPLIISFYFSSTFLASTEIDHNDDDMKLIAASLTRAQANAVRRRIDSLNEAIRQRNQHNEKRRPLPIQVNQKRKDVRNIFHNVPPQHKAVETNYVGQRYPFVLLLKFLNLNF